MSNLLSFSIGNHDDLHMNNINPHFNSLKEILVIQSIAATYFLSDIIELIGRVV